MAKNRPNMPGPRGPGASGAGGAGAPGAGGAGAPGAGGGAGGSTAGCSQCTITSQTVATAPSNRARTRIGVGEEVTLTVSPAPGNWSVSGGGRLSATSGGSVTFTAPDVAGTSTITAQTSSCSCTIQFEIVAPTGVTVEKDASRGAFHVRGNPSVGFVGIPHIQPDDVNFENVEVREEEVQAVGTGFLSGMTGWGHNPSPAHVSIGPPVAGKGSKANATDEIFANITQWRPPISNGTVTWSIPWVYRVGSGSEHPLTTIDQVATIDPQGTMTISKGGASETRRLNDPSSQMNTAP